MHGYIYINVHTYMQILIYMYILIYTQKRENNLYVEFKEHDFS